MNLHRFCFFLSMALSAPSLASADESSPRLLLLLTIDQGRGDYLERFRPALSGGLAWLVDEGVVFTDAHHAHAYTVTAAGHAALSTGRHPASSGMVGNDFYDRSEGKWVYSVEDRASVVLMPEGADGSSPGRSPARLLATGLADWIQLTSPESKVYSVGGKDRASILMGGKNADAAYWYDVRIGHWVTSEYYTSAYPAWVQTFHRERRVESYFGSTWSPLPVSEALLSRMEIETADGWFSRAFGRASLYPNRGYYNAVFYSPFLESYLFDFAERLVTEEELGADDTTDVLALSFASVDTVGHGYGPNSRELLDTVLRLDRELGEFFTFLDETVGLDRVAVSLSADHGVAPVPEYRASQGLAGSRRSTEDYVCVQRAGQAFEKKFGDDDWFVRAYHFDYETLARRNVSRATLESALKAELVRCPNIVQVWTRTEIEAAGTSSWVDPTLALFVHSFHPERSPDLYVVEKEFLVGNFPGTTHGSPHHYDTHVLALVRWPGAEPGSVSERIHTVDLPVTLASLLSVATPEGVDGVDRSKLIR